MPKKKKSAARTVAPFAPLALALVMGAVLPSSTGGVSPSELEGVTVGPSGATVTPVNCDGVTDSEDCHSRYPAGCGPTKYDTYTNILKNELTPPPPATEDVKVFTSLADYDTLNKSTPDGLGKLNHQDFKPALDASGEGQLREILGYLYYVKEEGPESSNCKLDNTDGTGANVDYHIGIGFDPAVAARIPTMGKMTPTARSAFQHSFKSNSVVVEMTPHYRSLFENEVWTFDNVKKVLGKQVKVVGQLMFDNEHDVSSQNCFRAITDSNLKLCWRYSVWELHPVVSFQVCGSKTGPCDRNSGDWVELNNIAASTADTGSASGGDSASQPATSRRRSTRTAAPQSGPSGQP